MQDERRVMAANPLVDVATYGVSRHQKTHFESLFCDGHLCEEAGEIQSIAFRRDNTPTEAKGDGG